MENKSKNIFTKPYLFHLHTTFADGKLTVENYFSWTRRSNYTNLIFLEHVKRYPSYSTQQYIDEIKRCRDQFEISSSIGFEARLLETGELDISDSDLKLADVVGMAIHGFSGNRIELFRAFTEAIKKYSHKRLVWVHPGSWFKRNGTLLKEGVLYMNMIWYAVERGIYIERNLRWNLPPQKLVGMIPQKRLVIGIDSHTREDLNCIEKPY